MNPRTRRQLTQPQSGWQTGSDNDAGLRSSVLSILAVTGLLTLAAAANAAWQQAGGSDQAPPGLPPAPRSAKSPETHRDPVHQSSAAAATTAHLRPGDRLTDLLLRAGVGPLDAALADKAATARGELLAAARIKIIVDPESSSGSKRLRRLVIFPDPGNIITVSRAGDAFSASFQTLQVDKRPTRIAGQVGGDFRQSLRRAGLTANEVGEVIGALSSRIPINELESGDRFALLIYTRSDSAGQVQRGPIIYIGMERIGRGMLQLVRWRTPDFGNWVDAAATAPLATGRLFIQPVSARVSSPFGVRVHPVLRFLRMHHGVDYAAPYGAGVFAAGAGVVVRAGWAGGYGNQVQLRHRDGSETSYSHLSAMLVDVGTAVAAGQQIGKVGSTGMSTGPHLHFELRRDGRPVDPLSTSFATIPAQPVSQAAARHRLRLLLSAPYRERLSWP